MSDYHIDWRETMPPESTPIVPTSGTKRVPDDSEAAYDWREDLDGRQQRSRLTAYIERLEAEYPCKGVMDCVRCEHRIPPDECAVLTINARHKAERDALRLGIDELSRMVDAGLQVSAERVLHGE